MTDDQLDMHKRLQPLYKRAMGERREGDKLYNTTCCYAPLEIVIPLTIDSEHPERGLWGMLDWKRWYLSKDEGGRLIIYDDYAVFSGDPTTAILKALCEQEGV